MIVLAAVPLILSGALALACPRLARLMTGRAATVLLTAVALASALSVGLVLSAIGCLALAQWTPFAARGHWSAATVTAGDPVPRWAAVACGVLAAALLSAAVLRATKSGMRVASSIRLCRALATTHPGELIVLDDGRAEAYALAGAPGRTVVTRGMLRALSGAERRALLAHEASHVKNCHFVYVSLVEIAVAANPLLRPLRPAVRLAVERWADEYAVTQVGDRSVVVAALARAGLARGGTVVPRGALGVAGSDVRSRVEALAAPPTGAYRGPAASAVLLVIGVCCVASSGALGLHLHDLIEWAQTVSSNRHR